MGIHLRFSLQLVKFFIISNLCYVSSQHECLQVGSTRITDSPDEVRNHTAAGRVEVCYNSSAGTFWSTVCFQDWDLNAGHVACRSNTAKWTAYTIVPGDNYLITELPHVLQVSCTGFESTLSECSINLVTTQTSSCNYRRTGGVICKTNPAVNDIVLVGGPSEREGFVQIFDGSSWALMSPRTDHWTPAHAQIACNQLGYTGGSIPVLATEPTGRVTYTNFVCPPNARGLTDCTDDRSIFDNTAPRATLSCSPTGLSNGALRLVRSEARSGGGVLEVSVNGRYNVICRFTKQEADTACWELGYLLSEESSSSSANVFRSKPASSASCRERASNLYSDCAFSTGQRCTSFAHITCTNILPHSYAAGIVFGILLLIAIILILIYHKQINEKFKHYRRRYPCRFNRSCCKCKNPFKRAQGRSSTATINRTGQSANAAGNNSSNGNTNASGSSSTARNNRTGQNASGNNRPNRNGNAARNNRSSRNTNTSGSSGPGGNTSAGVEVRVNPNVDTSGLPASSNPSLNAVHPEKPPTYDEQCVIVLEEGVRGCPPPYSETTPPH